MNRSSFPFQLVVLAGLILLAFLGRGIVEAVLINPGLDILRWLLQPIQSVLHILIWWVLFIPAATFLAIFSLRRPGEDEEKKKELKLRSISRSGGWAAWLERTEEGEYFRWTLARMLGEITIRAVGQKQRLEMDEAREIFRRGGLDLPPDIREYIQWAFTHRPLPGQPSLRERLFPSRPRTEPDFDVERIIAYLEDELGIQPESSS